MNVTEIRIPRDFKKNAYYWAHPRLQSSVSEHGAQESESLRNTPGGGSDVFWLPCEIGITETWPVKYEVDLIIDKTLDSECMGFYFVKDRHTTNQNDEQQPRPVQKESAVNQVYYFNVVQTWLWRGSSLGKNKEKTASVF